jgi:hypothetical protein
MTEKNQLMQEFKNLKAIVTEIEPRLEQFVEKDNKTAGTDVRKAMQDVKVSAQSIRELVQAIKNA